MLADLNFPATRWLCNDFSVSECFLNHSVTSSMRKGLKATKFKFQTNPANSKKPQINTRKNRKEKKKRPFFDLCLTGGGRRGYKSRCQPFLLNGLKTVTLQKDKASLSGECNRSSGTSFKTIRASKGQLTCTRNPGSIRIDSQPNAVLS